MTTALLNVRGAKGMGLIRGLARRHVGLAFLIVLVAMAMKIAVPPGLMIGAVGKSLTVEICDGDGGQTLMTMPSAKPGATQHSDTNHTAKECPYTALALASLSGASPALLALALAFAITLGFLALTPPVVARRAYARPPLRAPPTTTS